MLGDLVGQARGKRLVRRVLPDGKVEVSFEDAGTMLGMKCTGFGTYVAQVRPDGSIYGEGQGVNMSAKGELAQWKGMGVGKFVGAGVSYRGVLSFQSNSPTFSRLNTIAVVFEFETDAKGNTQSKLWEWK